MDDEPRWRYHIEGDSPYHVWPISDGIEHDIESSDGDCICGPCASPVKCEDGSVGWIYTHHSLDGREASE